MEKNATIMKFELKFSTNKWFPKASCWIPFFDHPKIFLIIVLNKLKDKKNIHNGFFSIDQLTISIKAAAEEQT